MSLIKYAAVVIAALSLTSCAKNLDGQIESTGYDAGFDVKAWCDENGTLTMGVKWGAGHEMEEVMISTDLGGLLGDVKEYDRSFGLGDSPNAELTIFVVPTDGRCYVSVTDQVDGAILQRGFSEDAKEFTLTGYASKS